MAERSLRIMLRVRERRESTVLTVPNITSDGHRRRLGLPVQNSEAERLTGEAFLSERAAA